MVWTTTPGVFELEVFCSNGAGPVLDGFDVYTMGTTATIHDLAALGAPLQSGGATCNATVISYPAFTTVDEVLTSPVNSVTHSISTATFFTQ